MYDEKLKIAYEKSNELINLISYKEDQMISTQEIIDLVEEKYCKDIDISFGSFADVGIKEPYGAMMKVILDDNNKPINAMIILNTDNDATFQRFSLLHEIGHLITGAWEAEDEFREKNANKYIVSTHINYNITNISQEEYENNEYYTHEQIANIFALRVLMPSKQFYSKVKKYRNITDVAKFFGLTEDAVVSRIMIGA